MNTALTVFVCSTFSDLSAERESVLEAIRRLQLQHDSMEFFGARSGQPIETCLKEVRKSNILVVIVGHRYGTIVSELGISFSEAEYEEGYRLKKPCLVYIRDENIPILPKHIERDPEKMRLLERWKIILQKRHTVAMFRDGHDLAVQVAADLSRTISGLEEAAQVRAEAQSQASKPIFDELNEIIIGAIDQGVPESSLLSAIRRTVSSMLSKEGQQAPTIFLSYANADQKIVRKVASRLADKGVKVWLDKDSIKPGSNWVKEIERGLDSADFVAFFISPSSVQRKSWVQQEMKIALHRQVSGERGAFLLPILLEHTDVPPLLRNIQWLDMTDKNVEKAVSKLLEVINYYSKRNSLNKESENE